MFYCEDPKKCSEHAIAFVTAKSRALKEISAHFNAQMDVDGKQLPPDCQIECRELASALDLVIFMHAPSEEKLAKLMLMFISGKVDIAKESTNGKVIVQKEGFKSTIYRISDLSFNYIKAIPNTHTIKALISIHFEDMDILEDFKDEIHEINYMREKNRPCINADVAVVGHCLAKNKRRILLFVKSNNLHTLSHYVTKHIHDNRKVNWTRTFIAIDDIYDCRLSNSKPSRTLYAQIQSVMLDMPQCSPKSDVGATPVEILNKWVEIDNPIPKIKENEAKMLRSIQTSLRDNSQEKKGVTNILFRKIKDNTWILEEERIR